MTPDVVVDIGNSRVKWGRVVPSGIGETAAFRHDDVVGWKRQLDAWGLTSFVRWAVAGVHPRQIERFQAWLGAHACEVAEVTTAMLLADPSRFGLRVEVAVPARVGVDRLMAALAAVIRAPTSAPVAAISVGTAMTVDFVHATGRFVGGAILPGPFLMAQSLHQYTARLPHIEIDPVVPVQVWGRYTEEAIELGIASAVLGAADQLLWDWADHCRAAPRVFVTGGDCGYFRGFVFTADTDGVVIDPALTLDGIRLAAEAMP